MNFGGIRFDASCVCLPLFDPGLSQDLFDAGLSQNLSHAAVGGCASLRHLQQPLVSYEILRYDLVLTMGAGHSGLYLLRTFKHNVLR